VERSERLAPGSLGFSPFDQRVVGLSEDADCNLTLELVCDQGQRTRVVFVDVWGYRWQRDIQDLAPGEEEGGVYEVRGSHWAARLDAITSGEVVGGGPLRRVRIQLNAAGMLDVVCADVNAA
jgi:hypothetical protein